jgi:2-furoate---CoA ligase
MLLRQMLELAAARHPDWPVVVDGDRRHTYAAWDARVNAVAQALRGLGVRRGDRVVQILKNREETCAIHMACQKLGAVNTPINFRWAAGEIEFCVNDAGARVVVCEDSTREVVLAALPRFRSSPRLLHVGADAAPAAERFADAVAAAPRRAPDVAVSEQDIALMLYTSGTTGRPKGVPRSQRAEYAATVAHIIEHRYARGERTLGVMPLYHTMGMHSLTSMIALNGLFVAMPEWDAGAALALIARERLTCLFLVPTLYHMLAHHPQLAAHDLGSLRKLGYAGAPMLPGLVRTCLERFRPEVLVNHYGSTEIYIFTTHAAGGEKPGCAGRPAFHSALRIVRPEAAPAVRPDETVPPGDTGEIIVSLASPEAFAGYHNRPEATARAIRDGWYFTGDTGYLDGEGDLWVTGRVDDMIITGGENVHPVEVEEVLAGHPDVADVAVAGLPDERWGQVVTAFVVPRRADLTAADLDAHCRASERLARFKRPRRIVLVARIPRSPVGKTLRRLLVAGEYEAASPPALHPGDLR